MFYVSLHPKTHKGCAAQGEARNACPDQNENLVVLFRSRHISKPMLLHLKSIRDIRKCLSRNLRLP